MKLTTVTRQQVVPSTVQQVHEMAANVPDRYRAMVHLAAATGLRQGELRSPTIDRVTVGVQSVSIRVDRQLVTTEPTWGPPKTARGDRTVTDGPESAVVLRRHIATCPCTGPG